MPIQTESSLGIVEYASLSRSAKEAHPKRDQYQRFSDEDCFEIGKYSALHGLMSTVIKFKNTPTAEEKYCQNLSGKISQFFKRKTTTKLSQKTTFLEMW